MTVPAAIRELDKLEMVRLVDNAYRPDHAVTSTQKIIFKALGIDSLYIKEQMKKNYGTVESEIWELYFH